MTRGTPDGNAVLYETATQITDLGAHANYLWGFAPVDGRGRMVFLDTFNNGLGAWVISGTPSNPDTIGNESDGRGYAFVPPYGVKFPTGSAGSATLTRNLILGKAGRYGIEAAFPMRGQNPNYYLYLNIRPNGVTNRVGGLFYYVPSNAWKISTDAGDLTLVTMQGNNANPTPYWVQVKFVADWTTGKYVRAIIGETVYDLSNLSMPVGGTSINGLAQARLEVYGTTDTVNGYLGYIMVTRDEV